MKSPGSFSRSFLNAIHGIRSGLFKQRNFFIEIIIALLVITGGIIFRINSLEWCLLLVCIMLVISLESLNTAIETLADALKPGFDPMVGKAKDIAAAAVLIASVFAGIIGLIIFAPRIIALLN